MIKTYFKLHNTTRFNIKVCLGLLGNFVTSSKSGSAALSLKVATCESTATSSFTLKVVDVHDGGSGMSTTETTTVSVSVNPAASAT
mmetsp:Transcript_16696/g.27082  ORF Transcript_16696/g.27082 Transcript_16696/m.27082 type:complete len:86 (+) Transcript_16696:60-317(+)